jgi:hypothetical protein
MGATTIGRLLPPVFFLQFPSNAIEVGENIPGEFACFLPGMDSV